MSLYDKILHDLNNVKSADFHNKDMNPSDLEDQSTITEEEELQKNRTVSDEYRDEILGMVMASLKNIVSDINGILDHVDQENVTSNLTEPWVQSMIAIIENNVTAVHDFVKFSTDQDDESTVSAKKRPGLWENIRKKKEREGKKYRPAKPGDKDRPDPETWKKLT